MQDPSIYSQMKPQFPEQEHLKCPRCDSANTKFCYYNNYNLSQPRHFCKNCRRYWTKGGALRNIPVGGGSRKNTKRSSSTTKRSSSATSAAPSTSPSSAAAVSSSSPPPSTTPQTLPKTEPYGLAPQALQPGFDQDRRMILDVGGNGSFSSLLSSNGGQFGNFLEGLNPNASNLQLCGFGDHGPNQGPGPGHHHGDPHAGLQNGSNSEEGFLSNQGNGDSSCWNGSNGWPDLAIYTPGSNFQ
ncbi:uncharacterized protein [Coffea arabica]|uniref:Dof zinc finger protein n=1 Tax=Coffea arabica TaxID=13443 RepID=A0A6P6XHW3_COFAR|nr:dof zinc finger protein DOF3.1-like [Coffea arabica]